MPQLQMFVLGFVLAFSGKLIVIDGMYRLYRYI